MDLVDCIQRLVAGMTSKDQRSVFGNACKCCCSDHRNAEKISTTETIAVLVYL